MNWDEPNSHPLQFIMSDEMLMKYINVLRANLKNNDDEFDEELRRRDEERQQLVQEHAEELHQRDEALRQRDGHVSILKLTLARGPFEATESGEKAEEYRRDSAWIRSRLFDSDGNAREYDFIKYYHGPCFSESYRTTTMKFQGVFWHDEDISIGPYSNGFTASITDGCWVICQSK